MGILGLTGGPLIGVSSRLHLLVRLGVRGRLGFGHGIVPVSKVRRREY